MSEIMIMIKLLLFVSYLSIGILLLVVGALEVISRWKDRREVKKKKKTDK